MTERILVTGGAGFIGSHLVDRLVGEGHQVTVLDVLDSQIHPDRSVPAYMNPEARFVQGDVRDADLLTRLVSEVDVVFHEAAAVGVGQSMYEIERYCDVNCQGTAVLMDVIVNRGRNVRKVVVASSMSIYGEGRYRCDTHGEVEAGLRSDDQLEAKDWELRCGSCGDRLTPLPTNESRQLRSPNVYALSKKFQEELVLGVCSTYRIPGVALRYFNCYGPRQSLSNPYTGVAAIFLSRLKNDAPPLVFEDGHQSRDFVSVHDLVSANLAVLNSDRADYQALNVGSGNRITVRSLAEALARVTGVAIPPQVAGAYRKGDIRHCFADISAIRDATGFSPQVSLHAGLEELCQWSEGTAAVDMVGEATAALQANGLLGY